MKHAYRYEWKFVLTRTEALTLQQRLKGILALDPHSLSEKKSYTIRSLYFDDPFSTAFDEKQDGVEYRKKYRIRMYNDDDSYLKLECKHKDEDRTYKEDSRITRLQAQQMMARNYGAIQTQDPFVERFLAEAMVKDLRPSVIVQYDRTAYVSPVSEVRITFDADVRSGRYITNLFDPHLNLLPVVSAGDLVLEVKYNEFLMEPLPQILCSVPMIRQAVSKFALCRAIQ